MRHQEGKHKLPRGVSWDRSHRGRKKYKTRVFFNGKDRFIGRFETIEEAHAAYQQAAALFKGSQENVDNPGFLERVRNLVVNQINDQPHYDSASAGQSPPDSSQTQLGGGVGVDLLQMQLHAQVHDEFGLMQQHSCLLVRQQSVPSSQHSASAAPLREDLFEGGAVAGNTCGPFTHMAAAAAPQLGGGGGFAGGLQGVGSNSLANIAAPANVRADSMDLSDQELEAVMTQEVLRAIGLLPGDQQQQQQLKTSPSCNSLPELAGCQPDHHQLQQQAPQSCAAPVLQPGANTAADAAAAFAGCSSFPAQHQQQQQQQQQSPEVESQADLQQLLHMALAGQLESAGPSDMCDHAFTRCCNEFLAATDVTAASPALSAPAGPAMMQHGAQEQHQHQPCYSTLSGPRSGPTQAATGKAAAAAAATAALTAAISEICDALPASEGLARQDSLLLQTSNSLDAVLYIAAVVRAVLDLYTAMLHRLFDEDAAADLIQWLSAFRQQQQYSGPAAIAAAAGSSAAAVKLEALSGSVMDVMGKVVRMLVTPGAAAAAAEAAADASDNFSSSGRASNATQAAANASGAPLAKRSFVMSVLERLNTYLVKLHRSLQQKQHTATPAAALWQEVQLWLQQLEVQAVSPEDRMAVLLAQLV